MESILEGGAEGESDWRKCDGVARILATCPQQSISTQLPDSGPPALQRQADSTEIPDCGHQGRSHHGAGPPRVYPAIHAHPLFSSLHCCGQMTGEGQTQDTAEEWELTCCVEDVL